MTTIRLDYSGTFDRAEYHDSRGVWRLACPDPIPGDTSTCRVIGQRACPAGGLHLRANMRYRVTPRLLSNRPPFFPLHPVTHWAPAPMVLEAGLDAPAWDGVGYIYLSAPCDTYLTRDLPLLTAHVTFTLHDAATAAAGALRRAGVPHHAEGITNAAARGHDACIRTLRHCLMLAPAWIARRPLTPPDQIDPAAGLVDVLHAALHVALGRPLPPPITPPHPAKEDTP